jgi:hypothetical protein
MAGLTVSTFLFLRKCIIDDLYIWPLTFAHDNIYYQATIKYHCFLMWLCYDITDLISPNTH